MPEGPATVLPAWGRTVEKATVNGHPVLVYSERPRSVADFLLSARRWRGRELLVQGDRRLTVEQHEAAVARVARCLAERGIGPGSRVALLGFNSIEWVVSFWAVQAVGAAAVLGNAWWSDGEAAGALEQARPDLVVTSRSVSWPTLTFEDLRTLVDDTGTDVPLPEWSEDEDALAIIMFTSGTTGAPKGVLMSRRSVVANIHNLLVLTGRLPSELPDEHPGTVSLLSVPMFHLAGIQVCCTTLLSGGRLVFLEGKFDPAQVLRLIESERVRSWGSIPTMVSRVLDHPDFAETDTSSLTSIPMGGAAVPSELRERIAASFPGVKSRASSLYGLTEAGGVLAAGSGKDVSGRPGCVGRALPVVELRILNPDAEGVGEIQARTPTATGGYLGDPAGVADEDGWIATGDLGRIDEDGWLYVTGRVKDIIIRGGENIASAHVEHALMSHPDVQEAAVVALPHPDLGEEVGAAVVLRPGASTTREDLLEHVSGVLASFERPSKWWRWDSPLPTNATGKVLRREVQDLWRARGAEDIWPS
ncbi:fatty acid--CoA ligase [Actinomadura sp. NBRC 104425]|uniref:class I adenylate-forming enzyme family protein n=1 Tax=Actinomadura sp. NBRC 104425 TaxID=3032204 RepID=UPI0024A5186F|nr:AMP-binding protein [Actinomadura sp. NBRC 104425]GLZ15781.1 fatty acid--CoA ligase [Actinomadura sp. NBRC 104425]